MTMPDKIYLTTGCGFEGHDILIANEEDIYNDSPPYIRDDIAEGLARSLEEAGIYMDYNAIPIELSERIDAALASYRALTP